MNSQSFSSIFPLESSLDSTIHILLEFQRPALSSLLATPLGGERRGIYAMAAMVSTEFLNSIESAVSGLLSDVSAVERRGIYAMAAVVSSKKFLLESCSCLLYTSDAADDLLCVDLGGRRIIKKKNTHKL
eukprot:TRINITY_DN1816_c0_g1_i1.p1 TRINITY_DN1816_c0_g1~~TRINITY_DN1816_c0_g1_i1.p1  ORF type:complete len:130 (-),score=21.66 TRINITY_DN1816_c0_g1_i1:86-475(-)